ncbi:MAG: type III secretion system HrpP C-terminal domain-containing protein [Pseudomonadota bacterium]
MTQPIELKPARVPSRDYERDLRQAVASVADSQLFAGLMAGGTSRVSPSAADVRLAQAVSDQLLLRVSGASQWPIQFVIELARRGRVHVSARYERRVWTISLQAEQAATSQWLGEQQQSCQQSLARRLGQPVRVLLIPERQA